MPRLGSFTNEKVLRSATAADFQEFDFQACLDSIEREILTFAKLSGIVTSTDRKTVKPREIRIGFLLSEYWTVDI